MTPLSNAGKITGGKTLSTEKLLEYLPALKEIPKTQYENWARDAAALRIYEKGDIICEEGSFGSTAFYIVSGKVEIYISNPMAHIETSPSLTKMMGRTVAKMKSFLTSGNHPDDKGRRKFIPVDASIDLPVNRPVGQLDAGELFGEMTCRTFQPRSATVRATEDCVIVEMLRVILDMLMGSREVSDAVKTTTKIKIPTFKGTSFKKEIDDKYRQRSLITHLRSVALFESVSEEFIENLSRQVQLVTYDKGQVICQQGDEADAFYLIRHGMVKVAQTLPGGEMVRAYMSRGEFFGEMGLILSKPRSATCTALDSVDLVKVSAEDFTRMVVEFPGFKEEVMEVAQRRLEADQISNKQGPLDLTLDEYLNQGLFEAQNLLVIDLDKCTRCDLCVQACAEAHDGTSRLLRDGLRYDKYLVATACRSCRDPLCMTQCPVGSIRRTDNLEIIIEDWCIGCTKCAELCPYGNINMHSVEEQASHPVVTWAGSLAEAFGLRKKSAPEDAKAKKPASKATTCDLCTEMETPSCVYACPHDAAKRIDPTVYFSSQTPDFRVGEGVRVRFDPRTTHEVHK